MKPLPKSRKASLFLRAMSAAVVAATLSLGLFVAQPAQAGSVVIRDFVLTHGINEREPMGTTEQFAMNDQRGFAFARLNNDGAPTNVSFVWEIDNQVHASIDMSVAIRTMTFRRGGAFFNVGGGIVIDSDPKAEYEESLLKAKAIFSALECKF